MNEFAQLYRAIDETNKTNDKVAAMVYYFRRVSLADGAWAVSFLIGRRPKRLITMPRVWEWASERSGLPTWLFGECYDAVGDFAETLSLILGSSEQTGQDRPLHEWVEDWLLPLSAEPEEVQRAKLEEAWAVLSQLELFVLSKLMTGAFRVGVSQELVLRALSKAFKVPIAVLSHRMMGNWVATPEFFEALVAESEGETDPSRPYPFCLAYPLEGDPSALGDINDWQAEWKWDGIRSQVVRREGQVYVWSRGEELVTGRFPEVEEIGNLLPEGTVLDGEILGWANEKPLRFLELQKRIGRQKLSKSILAQVPVALVAYDVLEWGGEDVRAKPMSERRAFLEELKGLHPSLRISPLVTADSWEEMAEQRAQSRGFNVEGLMLKHRDSKYLVGRKKGQWWKWKIEPFSLDAVLIYAQRGSGKRASLYTDYTFGVWDNEVLVPIAKAYSGLTDEEIKRVDAFVRRNTLEKFGPVRTVTPELVMEIAFESIQLSNRHKSGIAVRFPRILRWRLDKKAEEADTLDGVKQLLAVHG